MCETLSTIQVLPEFGKYFAQNSLSALTQVFEECWSGVLPPTEIWSGQVWHFTLDLSWPGVHPSPKNENLVKTWHF